MTASTWNTSSPFAKNLRSHISRSRDQHGNSCKRHIPWNARIPLPALKAIASTAGTFKKKEVTVVIEDGAIKIDTFRHGHPGIKLGILPDQRIDLPVGASLLDTLGVGTILTESGIEEQGLTNRILDAWERANRAITSAAGSLAALGISEQQIRQLVEVQVTASGQRLLAAFSLKG